MDSVGDVRVSGTEPENTLCHVCVRVCVVDEEEKKRREKRRSVAEWEVSKKCVPGGGRAS